MELNRRVLLDDLTNKLIHRGGRQGKFRLVINVIFHHSREADSRHILILAAFCCSECYTGVYFHVGKAEMKIFISYRRSDSKIFTGRILDRLTRVFGGRSIFRDIEDISPGKDFRQVLKDAVNEAHLMLVMIGPQWATSTDANGNKRLFDKQDFVRFEVETGLKKNGMIVIPVLLLNTPMPASEELPIELRELLYRNAVVIRDDPDFSTDLQRLVSQIRRIRPIENVLRWGTYVLPVVLFLFIAAFIAIRGITNPPPPTPESTFTPAPPAIGQDWANGCISVLWRPYPDTIPISTNNGCLSQPIVLSEAANFFFTENGSLKFSVTNDFENPQLYGLFAPIPANGVIRIDTFVRSIQGGEIWMGVFAEPEIESQGLVTVLLPGENINSIELIQRKMPEQAEINQLDSFAEDPTQDPPRYSIVFELNNGEVRVQKLGETEFTAVPLNSAQLWLFVGYRVAAGNNRIDAEFLNLLIQGL